MNCNLTDEERKTKKARCRSWDCSGCNNFYSNCLNEEINKQEKENQELKAKLEKAIKALEFYADEKNWNESLPEISDWYKVETTDRGILARQALKEIKGE